MSLIEPPTAGTRERRRPAPNPPVGAPVHPMLWTIVLLIVALEGMQTLAAMNMAPAWFDRWAVFSALAFFDADFDRALAGGGFGAQLVWSSFTHAFLHAGWLHLAFNMAAFLGLGHAIVRAVGIGRFLVVFVACAIAGALTLGLISDVRGPLVGASGAVFGFFGMVTAWQERALARRGLSRRPIWTRIAGLVAINALLAWGMGGLLAWEAHLGGWVVGWLLGLAWRPQSGVRLPF